MKKRPFSPSNSCGSDSSTLTPCFQTIPADLLEAQVCIYGWVRTGRLLGFGLRLFAEEDKRNSLLISRVACLGRLRHQSQGYAGPLSRHMLGYNSITNVVRESLRDLAEISLTTLLLNGKVDRDRDDWMDISLG